ncbi:MAG: protoporphyrinogen oxidase [Pirellulaceae bacterium]
MSLPAFPSPAAPLAPPALPRRIAIIGGGISGLAAANRVRELCPEAELTLFEAADRLGGVLQTDRRDGWLIERSADMFTTREPWALDLCRRLGIADELLETDPRFRRAYVVWRGRPMPVPAGFTLMSPARAWPILKTPILSPLGKLRLACESFIPRRRDPEDESLESFVVRRFGREAFDRLVQPLIGGIYTADPAKLSIQATMPLFVELERKYGSLIRGMRRERSEVRGQRSVGHALRGVPGQGSEASEGRSELASGGREPPESSGARYGLFVAPSDGMQRLVDAVAARLPPEVVRLSAPVERIVGPDRRAGLDAGPWQIFLRGQPEAELFDDLILAAPAPVCGRLLTSVDEKLAALVGSIPHAGCSLAFLGIRREQLSRPLAGFGLVAPAIEKRKFIAASLASLKFPGRAPEGKLLLRVFVGGAMQPDLAALPDGELRELVLAELRDLLGLTGEPEFFEVARWLGAMPQYHVGHLELVRQIEQRAAAVPHFALAGNAYRGVGVPQSIHSGEQAAERIVNAVRGVASPDPA